MIRRSCFVILLFALLLISFVPVSFAFYQWTDEQGNLHITDNPPPTRQVPEKPEPARSPAPQAPEPSSAVVPAPVSPPSAQPAPAVSQKTATIPANLTPSVPVQAPAAGAAAVAPQSRPAATVSQQTASVPAAASAPAPAPPAPAEAPQAAVPSPLQRGTPPANVVAALVASFLVLILVIGTAAYVYFSLCLYLIAKKLNVAEAWAAWIPLIQIWPFLSSAGKPCWWVLLLFIPFVNAIVGVYLWMCIAENLGREKWLGLLMLLPIINLVFLGVLAFSQAENAGPAAA